MTEADIWFLYDIGLRHERVKKENLTQVFSCEFCEIFKNTFFIQNIVTTAAASQIPVGVIFEGFILSLVKVKQISRNTL